METRSLGRGQQNALNKQMCFRLVLPFVARIFVTFRYFYFVGVLWTHKNLMARRGCAWMLWAIQRVPTYRLCAIVSIFIITSFGLFYMVKTLKYSIIVSSRWYMRFTSVFSRFFWQKIRLLRYFYSLSRVFNVAMGFWKMAVCLQTIAPTKWLEKNYYSWS